jgi:hypothetical protein
MDFKGLRLAGSFRNFKKSCVDRAGYAMAGVDMMRAYARRTLKKVPFSPYENAAI